MLKIEGREKFKYCLQSTLIGFLIILFSVVLGSGMAIAFNYDQGLKPNNEKASSLKSVDAATGKYKVGEELYLENCSKCHIPIPPAVLPVETWKKILENPLDHYGTKVEGIIRLTQVLMWEYVSNYSRNVAKDEGIPSYIAQSRYFKALHPKVDLPNPITHRSCVSCHPNAIKFDYRTIIQQN